MCIKSTPMLDWVRVQNPWRYPHWVIQERWGNTKRRIKVEQAFLIYSNARKKKREKMSKSNSVNPLAVSTLSNARKAGEYSDKEESTSKKLKTALILRIRSVYAQCSQVLFSKFSLNVGVKVSSSLGKNTLSV